MVSFFVSSQKTLFIFGKLNFLFARASFFSIRRVYFSWVDRKLLLYKNFFPFWIFSLNLYFFGSLFKSEAPLYLIFYFSSVIHNFSAFSSGDFVFLSKSFIYIRRPTLGGLFFLFWAQFFIKSYVFFLILRIHIPWILFSPKDTFFSRRFNHMFLGITKIFWFKGAFYILDLLTLHFNWYYMVTWFICPHLHIRGAILY